MENDHVQEEQAVDPVPSTRKRRRRGEDKDNDDNNGEDDHGELRPQARRVKVQTNPHQLRRSRVEKTSPSAFRSSSRLRKLRESREQLSPGEEEQTKRLSTPAQHRGQRETQSQKNISKRPQGVNRTPDLPYQGNTQARSWEPPKTRRGKRRRTVDSEDEPSRAAQWQRRQGGSGVSAEQVDSIERWLDESCSSQTPLIAYEARLLEAVDTMLRKPTAVLPSPKDSFDRTPTSSRKSERTTASVYDSDYRDSLRNHNIYIEREDPPAELMRRAHIIISRSRASPEADDIAIQELKDKSRQLQEDAEEEIVQQLAPGIIPAMSRLPDGRLARNADQPWSNAVPIPLMPYILTNPLSLPKPKPDLAFGYAQAAFTEKQRGTIGLLIEDQSRRSYAVPDQKLRFPFLDIEFKSQAKNGTHYIATNQVAGNGAIALSGNMDLMQRSFGMEKFDYEEPQFFSVTMDHELARINVHWLKAPANGGTHSFHVEGLSQHLLRDAGGIRAVQRAIKNILDYGADPRLRTLCEALDAYREIVVRNREAASSQRLRRHDEQPNVHGKHGRRDSEVVVEETSAKNLRYTSVPRDSSANEPVTEQ